MTCGHCVGAQKVFSIRTARRDLKRLRRRGPRKTTRHLVEALLSLTPNGPGTGAGSLIDIGGGVGAIPFELFQHGLESAVVVDASPAYTSVLREESERRGVGDSLEVHQGDFLDVVDLLDDADLVSLDRVICCYPDVQALLTAAGHKARGGVALCAPTDRAWIRPLIGLANLYCRITRNPFRIFAHPWALVDSTLEKCGLERMGPPVGFLWRVAAYRRRRT